MSDILIDENYMDGFSQPTQQEVSGFQGSSSILGGLRQQTKHSTPRVGTVGSNSG